LKKRLVEQQQEKNNHQMRISQDDESRLQIGYNVSYVVEKEEIIELIPNEMEQLKVAFMPPEIPIEHITTENENLVEHTELPRLTTLVKESPTKKKNRKRAQKRQQKKIDLEKDNEIQKQEAKVRFDDNWSKAKFLELLQVLVEGKVNNSGYTKKIQEFLSFKKRVLKWDNDKFWEHETTESAMGYWRNIYRQCDFEKPKKMHYEKISRLIFSHLWPGEITPWHEHDKEIQRRIQIQNDINEKASKIYSDYLKIHGTALKETKN